MSEIGFCSIFIIESSEFNQILYTHDHRQHLYWYCKAIFFDKCSTELRPLIDVRNWFLLNILRMNGQNLTKFCIHFFIIIDMIYVCFVNCHFSQICNRVTALDWFQKLFFCSISWEWIDSNLSKFCIHIIIDKIYVGKVKSHFSQICNGVMALDWCQKLVFAQYLDNEYAEFNQILYIHYHWHDLSTISSSKSVLLLNISLFSDSAMAGLWSDPLTILVFAGNKNNH